MTNPMIKPNYSGVTIQIANPAVNVTNPCEQSLQNQGSGYHHYCGQNHNCGYNSYPLAQNYNSNYYGEYANNQAPLQLTTNPQRNVPDINLAQTPMNNAQYPNTGMNYSYPENQAYAIPTAQGYATYPAQYYLNNYNGTGQNNGMNNGGGVVINNSTPQNESQMTAPNANSGFVNDVGAKETSAQNQLADINKTAPEQNQGFTPQGLNQNSNDIPVNAARDDIGTNGLGLAASDQDYTLKHYDVEKPEQTEQDFTKSSSIIKDIDSREQELKAEQKNAKQKRVVALTDEYIKSLENYLNNPNQEIRLMASKEILTRLDEDKSRFDDAALNALLNKMLQDPSKLIRVASLSAFNAQLASGNDYTIHLLNTIQQNPSADKEDVLQAADILLKMSAGTEVKYIPDPSAKEKTDTNKGGEK